MDGVNVCGEWNELPSHEIVGYWFMEGWVTLSFGPTRKSECVRTTETPCPMFSSIMPVCTAHIIGECGGRMCVYESACCALSFKEQIL
jgi:hypothetical protein